ncbi:MAG: two-component regulator propeller domain-containing protein [Prolixibacteraceae bacterium]
MDKKGFVGLLLVFYIIVLTSFHSYSASIQFQNLGIDDGLSQSLVSSMVEDDLGFLWFGTQEGLNRYDGYNFKKYYAGNSNRNPSRNWINHLYKDRSGQIWIVYQGAGLDRFDPQKEYFYKYDVNEKQAGAISSTSFSIPHLSESEPFFEDHKNNLWIGTENGLNLFNRETNSFTTFHPENSISNIPITAINEDNNGKLWIGTNHGLNILDPETKIMRPIYSDPGEKNFVSDTIVTFIHISSNNTIWVGTLHNGIFVIENPLSDQCKISNYLYHSGNPNLDPSVFNIYHATSGKLIVGTLAGPAYFTSDTIANAPILFPELKTLRLNLIEEDQKSNIWMGSRNEETIIRINGDDYSDITSYRLGEENKYNQLGQSILFIKKSKNGLLWVSKQKDGIYKLDVFAKEFNSIDANPNKKIHLSNPEVYSIYEDMEREKLYIGTHYQLNVLDKKTNKIKTFGQTGGTLMGVDYQYSKNIPFVLIGAMEPDKKGNIWIGSFDYKTSLYNPETNTFLNFHQNDANPTSFLMWSLRDILVTSTNQVYFGGTNQGLCKLLEDGKSFKYYPVNGDHTGTNADWINVLKEGSNGKIWIGTIANGLNVFNPTDESFEYFTHNEKDATSLSDNNVRSILEPKIFGDDILWIGTENGLNKFDKKTGTFQNFIGKSQLLNISIIGILEDNKGRLWMSSNKGIVYFDPITETSRLYTKDDGLIDTEFNEGAYFKNDKGILYFGGLNGLNYFDPNDITLNPFESESIITDFKLFNKSVLPDDSINNRVLLDKSISYTKTITLSHKDKIFSFEFTSLHMVSPQKLKFKYMLEGFENEWNEVDGTQRFANYTNIPSGKYTFKVLSCNNDGNWSNNPAQLSITIKPPFYETKWFIISVFILIVGLTNLFVQLRLRMLQRQKEELQEKVEKRTKQLSDVNSQLKIHQNEIINQNEQIAEQNKDLSTQNQLLEIQKVEIQNISEKLHESHQMKLKFFTNISHEFKTPLTLIMGPTEKLLEQNNYDDSKEVKGYLKLMHRNEKRLFRLINQLLEINRIEASTLKLSTKLGDIVSFTSDIYELFIPMADKRDIDFQFHTDQESFVTLFDADKIEKILYNLLSNAFKFTPIGNILSLTIDTQKEILGQKAITFKVFNQGKPIAPEYIEHIFDRFYQISEKSDSGQISTGIGLSLCHDLVKAHKGEIELMSSEQQGTTFIIKIPINHPDYETLEQSLIPQKGDYSFDYMKSMIDNPDFYENGEQSDEDGLLPKKQKLLIVEDNDDMLNFLANEFKQEYDVITAVNGEEGINLAKEYLPDLIISDIMMPVKDGLELCNQLKNDQLTSHIPIFLLTAKSEIENQISGLKSKADDYIVKPFSPQALRLKIENLLETRSKLASKFTSQLEVIPENINISEIDHGFLEKFVAYVETNMSDLELSGDVMARELCISKGNLYKKLKSLTGMTVNIFIRTIRLKTAAKLLRNGNYGISDVAYSVGFSNPKYFSTCFSELFGISPKEYANNKKNDAKE